MTAPRFIALLLALGPLAAGCRPAPRAAGPLPQAIYVWQRAWTPAVSAAVADGKNDAAGFAVLAAEVAWRDGAAQIARPGADWAALNHSGRPVELVLRIGARREPFAADDAAAATLARLAAELWREAESHALTVAALQIDYDCAESRLADYRGLLRRLRAAVAPLPVTPTVLPSWLDRRDFAALARDSGGFVLQVHSTATPRLGVTTLCDPAAARRWAERAGRLGVPFRVALPTYAYLAAFDGRGKFLGVEAEGPARQWPPGATRQFIRADARELAALARAWERDRPPTLTGLIWYRLPVAGDRLNWRAPTLAAVMRGAPLRASLDVTASAPPLCDFILANRGNLDAPLPLAVTVTWSGGPLAAGDAVGGYTLAVNGRTATFTRPPAATEAPLPPGEKRVIGWLRFGNGDGPPHLSIRTD
jgi:hypothetical protein